ncbi:unnamed protein product [Effrenium voratum]|uniref:Uncharacterized protein n=1 Tax=Effrenium voratum TaxID=2562239 RepID=A0AA36IU13_9DINO|nr:unnamed protein product [Effrenium voratum]CAJ1451265.1 unnamed protein product [Effrenium voratum]
MDEDEDAELDVNDSPFDADVLDLDQQQYGRAWMLQILQALMPIAKPPEVANLKFLICPDAGPADEEGDRDRIRGRDRKGKGNHKGQNASTGRFIPEMGRTEIVPRSQRGTWWRNCCRDKGDVIIREQFLLTSEEICRVPFGQYVLQAGPLEVFVNGPAQGLQRMPVQPRGWATVDATAVNGPLYLDKVKSPKWTVIFSSGSTKGDIVVRRGVSLDSDEVAVLACGTMVEQAAPLEVTEDGIIRMQITFEGREPSTSSHAAKARMGWVTCDATAQGGPKFFEPVDPERYKAPRQEPQREEGTWEVNRIWRVMNLQDEHQLPLVRKCEPYAPGSGKIPPPEMLVRHLVNGEVVHQVGHSKKVRGYMVMPVKVDSEEGWVVRRLVDTNREQPAWFEEIVNGEPRERKKHRNRDRDHGQWDQHGD